MQSLVNYPKMRFLIKDRLGRTHPSKKLSSQAILTSESRLPYNQNGKKYVCAAEPAEQFVLSDSDIQIDVPLQHGEDDQEAKRDMQRPEKR